MAGTEERLGELREVRSTTESHHSWGALCGLEVEWGAWGHVDWACGYNSSSELDTAATKMRLFLSPKVNGDFYYWRVTGQVRRPALDSHLPGDQRPGLGGAGGVGIGWRSSFLVGGPPSGYTEKTA